MENTDKTPNKNQFKIFDNMLEGISVYKLIFNDEGKVIDGILEYMNFANVEALGISIEESIGKKAAEIFNSDFLNQYIGSINKYLVNGKFNRFETYYLPTDRYFIVSGFDIGHNYFVILRTDITEQKKAEERIRQNEEKYQSLFNNNHAPMLIINPDSGDIIDFNSAASVFYGYSKDELIRMKITDINVLTKEEVFKEMQKARSEKKNYFSFKHRLSSGEIRDVDTYSGPIVINGKKFLYSIIHDVTKQEKAEEALKQSETNLARAQALTHVGSWILDPETKIARASDEYFRILGISPPDIYTFEDFNKRVHPDDRKRRNTLVSESLKKGKYPDIDYRIIRPDGEVRYVHAEGEFKLEKGKHILFGTLQDITEQRKMEQELRKAHDHLEEQVKERTLELEKAYESLKKSKKGLAEAQRIAHLGNWEWNITTNELYWSDEIYRIFGRKPQEFGATYDAFLSYVHPDDKKYVDNKVKEALSGNPYNIDHRIILANGKERIVREQGEVTFDGEKNPILMVGTVQDITEQKLAEQQILRLANIVESSDDAIFGNDLHGVITSWNRGAEKIYGYKYFEIVGKHISVLMDPEEWEKVSKLIDNVKKGRTVANYEGIRLRKDGSKFNASVTLSPIRDLEWNIVGISVIARDITERKKAEENLKRSETILQEATRLSKVGAYEWDIKKDRFISSREWRRIHGIKEKSLPSKEMIKIVYLEDTEKVQKAWRSALKGKKPYNVEHRIINQFNGKVKYVHALGTVIKDENGNPDKMYGVAHDITESKLASIERENLIKDLRRSNDELRQFAFITSHDLQEPLRTMASYAGLLKRRYEGQLDKDADEFIEYIVSGATRMRQMIVGLLEYSRVGTHGGDFSKFNVYESLKDSLANLELLIKDNNAQITYDPLPEIFADFDQISLVFQNLIMNAIKFRKKDEIPKIHISARKEKNEYVFSVSDNSIGMNQEYTDKIFEIFKRLHAIGEYGGAGIGLAIVKRIIDRHGGRIWVESSLGKGSTFYFTIPLNK
ncbi:PAS domain S-box protein [Methanobacterium oryzae]|uniref:PAS domain S-box protein n=1 Tax=Methanobacterium oryzae TaxID=69540 RepID=UPI003D2305AB